MIDEYQDKISHKDRDESSCNFDEIMKPGEASGSWERGIREFYRRFTIHKQLSNYDIIYDTVELS